MFPILLPRIRSSSMIVRGHRLERLTAKLPRSRERRNQGPREKEDHDPMAASTRVATTREIRAHFPALERRQGARTVAYFDGPGGTQVPRAVVEAMSDYLYHHNAN